MNNRIMNESIFINQDEPGAEEGYKIQEAVFKILHDAGVVKRNWKKYTEVILEQMSEPEIAELEKIAKLYPSFITGFNAALGALIWNRIKGNDIIGEMIDGED